MDQEEFFGVPSAKEQVRTLLTLIDEEWFHNEQNWLFIGQCLFNTMGREGQEVWDRYTPPQYAESLNRCWQNFEKTRYGLSAVRCLAKDHNYDRFDEWQTQLTNAAVLGALAETAGTTELADITKFLFGDVFICSDVEHKKWWQFNGNSWEELSGGHSFRQKFSRVLVNLFDRVLPALTVPADRNQS